MGGEGGCSEGGEEGDNVGGPAGNIEGIVTSHSSERQLQQGSGGGLLVS